MEKKTMGSFITALRKANGMTQQELADRLYVSNKAVSRWERDESAPDLSLIPAIAEIFGITCDELLKGERILQEPDAPQREARVEKQVRSLVHRATASFQTLIWISLSLSVVGLILMLGITYGFYRPVIGFSLMLLIETAAVTITAIAITKYKEVKQESELFEQLPELLAEGYYEKLAFYSYFACFAALTVFLLSLPLLLLSDSGYLHRVLSAESYLTMVVPITVLILFFLFQQCKGRFGAWITGRPYEKERNRPPYQPRVRKLSLFQLCPLLVACLLFTFGKNFETKPEGDGWKSIACTLVAVVLCGFCFLCGILFPLRSPGYRKPMILFSLRNTLLIIPTVILYDVHRISFLRVSEVGIGDPLGTAKWERYDIWHPEYILLALGIALGIYLVFHILIRLLCPNPTKKEHR